ncbi:MAG: hypothetical protein JWM80_2357 [Cyanobacteria bacterium RYN_339]|nr:hypothetical protein [Cyanobacteria bacterium RYN_339]
MTPSEISTAADLRRITLSLPESLIQDVIRLAELRGRPFDQELAEDFAFLLRLSGGPRPGTMLEHLFEAERLDEPMERVATALPKPLFEALGAIARGYGTTRAMALTALMRRGVRRLLEAETISLEEDLTFLEAWLALLQPGRVA